MSKSLLNHRDAQQEVHLGGTEAQSKEKSVFSVSPLCLCASVVAGFSLV